MAGRSRGQGDEAGEDRRHRGDLPRADPLVEDPRPDDQQDDQADREYRLDHGQWRDQQGSGLKAPSGGDQQRAQEPSPTPGETGEQRGPQRLRGRRVAGLERLEGDPAVVERRRQQRADHSERDEAHR